MAVLHDTHLQNREIVLRMCAPFADKCQVGVCVFGSKSACHLQGELKRAMPPQHAGTRRPCCPAQAGPLGLPDVKAAEAEVRRRMHLLQRRRKRLTDFVGDVAFILFVWTVPDTTLCSAYLEAQPTGEGECSLSIDALQLRYLAATVGQINAIVDKDKSVGAGKLSAAARFRRDFELARWIETENSTKGNAPTVALVQAHLSQEAELPLQNGAARIARPPCKVSSKWVQRFRKRCNLTRGSFAARAPLPIEAARDKATY